MTLFKHPLSQWLEYESRERLIQAWEMAKPLCALHHAVSYQHIIATLEPRAKQELHQALPYFIKKVIKSVNGVAQKNKGIYPLV
jgi:hypothetical protein